MGADKHRTLVIYCGREKAMMDEAEKSVGEAEQSAEPFGEQPAEEVSIEEVPASDGSESSGEPCEENEPQAEAVEAVEAVDANASEEDVDSEEQVSLAEEVVDVDAEASEEAKEEDAPAAPEPVVAAPVEVVEEKVEKKQAEEAEEEESGDDQFELSPEQAALPWYVVHAYSGYEMRAKLTLEERIRSTGISRKFGEIIVPEEKVVELVRGEKKTSTRKFFPGYILVQCDLDDETWHLVKDTPKITGFVGDSRNPAPITEQEVQALVKQMEGGAQRPRPSVQFEQGDSVKVVDGPFADFNGTVDEVKPDKGKLRVLISIFGRNTPVELDFVQVEKV